MRYLWIKSIKFRMNTSAASAEFSAACRYGSGLSLLESAPRVCTEEAKAVTWMDTSAVGAGVSVSTNCGHDLQSAKSMLPVDGWE